MMQSPSRQMLLLAALPFFCGAVCSFAQTVPGSMVVPVPKSVVVPGGDSDSHRLRLDAGQSVSVEGCGDGFHAAVSRFVTRLEARTGIPRVVSQASDLAVAVAVTCNSQSPQFGFDPTHERYQLAVDATGVRIQADRPVGAMHAFETLVQLVDRDSAGFYLPHARVEDQPRFAWRGLLLDPARHFLPVSSIRQTLDAMAAVKLNVLHWHLTDDQGFRVESRKFPRLHERGSDGQYYTQDQVRELVAYAAGLGIRVVPEFDVPGHTGSWLVGHPELAPTAPPGHEGPHEQVREYGIQNTVMDPKSDAVLELLGAFFDEMAGLFPDEVLHIGGDEVNGVWWRDLGDKHELQNAFNHRIAPLLERNGKRMMGWAEIEAAGLPGAPIIHVWNDTETLNHSTAVNNGYDAVFSFGYYLDLMYPAWSYHAMEPLRFAQPGLDRSKILGGEACMWGELVTEETLNAHLWPSTAAVAERLWSDPDRLPEFLVDSEFSDRAALYARLDQVGERLRELGVDPEADLEAMRRRLVPGSLQGAEREQVLDALERLAAVLQPPRWYLRHRLRGATQLTPLNTLADSLAPESRVVRELEAQIESEAWAQVRESLQSLRGLGVELNAVFARDAAERSVVDQVERLAEIGLLALERGTALSAAERDALLVEVDAMPAPEETIVQASLEGASLDS